MQLLGPVDDGRQPRRHLVGEIVLAGDHGAQAGGFSPISVYGGITNQVVQKAGLEVTEMAVFLTSLGFNLLMGIICFFAFGGLAHRPWRVEAADAAVPQGAKAVADLALAGFQATEQNRFKVTLAERTLAAALSDARMSR